MRYWLGMLVMAVLAGSLGAQGWNNAGPTKLELFSNGRPIAVVGGTSYNPAMVARLNELRGYQKPDLARISGGPGVANLYDNNSYQVNENWVSIRWPGGPPTWINLRDNWVSQGPRNGIGLSRVGDVAIGVGGALLGPEAAAATGGKAISGATGLLPGGNIVSGDYAGRRDGYTFVFHRQANEPFGFVNNWRTDNVSSVQVLPNPGGPVVPVSGRLQQAPQGTRGPAGVVYLPPGPPPSRLVPPSTSPPVRGVYPPPVLPPFRPMPPARR